MRTLLTNIYLNCTVRKLNLSTMIGPFAVLIALSSGTCGLSGSAYAQSLDAYWTADGTTADASGNGNTLTLENGVSYGPGKYGQAFVLNGSNQYAADPTPTFNLVGQPSFTISLWANFSSFNYNPAGTLPNTFIGEDNGAGSQAKWVFYYDAATASLGFHVNGGAGSRFAEAPVGTTPPLNSWNMFSVTGDVAASSVSFYYDGQFLATETGVHFSAPNTAVTIGEAEGAGYFHGGLDDIRIYNSALTAAQIHTLYANSSSVPEPSAMVAPLACGLGLAGTLLHRRRK